MVPDVVERRRTLSAVGAPVIRRQRAAAFDLEILVGNIGPLELLSWHPLRTDRRTPALHRTCGGTVGVEPAADRHARAQRTSARAEIAGDRPRCPPDRAEPDGEERKKPHPCRACGTCPAPVAPCRLAQGGIAASPGGRGGSPAGLGLRSDHSHGTRQFRPLPPDRLKRHPTYLPADVRQFQSACAAREEQASLAPRAKPEPARRARVPSTTSAASRLLCRPRSRPQPAGPAPHP